MCIFYSSSYKSKYASDTDALLAERSRLDNSHGMIDRTLDQAYATRADLSSQRDLIGSIASRMTTTAQSLPGINGVITMIGRRRRRDSIIMGLVIGPLLLSYFIVLMKVFERENRMRTTVHSSNEL